MTSITNEVYLRGAIIVVSDRIVDGAKEDVAGPLAQRLLADAAVNASVSVVAEGRDDVAAEIDNALRDGARVVLTIGGTGLGPRNLTPEATAPHIHTQLTGLMTQVLVAGLANSPQAGLSRGMIGLSGRDKGAALLMNAPSSRGGVTDLLDVVVPLLPNIFERIDRG